MKKSVITIIFIAFVSVLLVNSSEARRGRACRADVEKLCSDKGGNRQEVRKCLNEKYDNLSDVCREFIDRGRKHRMACKADVEKLCSDRTGGGREIGMCLEENYEQLSDSCRDSIDNRRRHRRLHRGHR